MTSRNLSRAMEISDEIEDLYRLRKQLRSAIHISELGPTHPDDIVVEHPLWTEANARITALRHELVMLI